MPGETGYSGSKERVLRFARVRDNPCMPFKDPEAARQYHLKYGRDANKAAREFADSLKERCGRCGYDKCKNALVFHHHGDKEFNLSDLVRRRPSHDRILAEVAKCEVLCANCHSEEHCQRSEC